VLVTALNLDLGRWVWWPSRLARNPAPEAELPRADAPVRSG
jgi:RND superfamily putative drug exporter